MTTEQQHSALAALWNMYNSRSGQATARQIAKIKRQLSIDDLTRMLTARNVDIAASLARLTFVD